MSYEAKPVFLSYSRSDIIAAGILHRALEQAGLKVFKDDKSIRAGERWLSALEKAVKECTAFVVLVGSEGVRRWVAGEVQVALIRHYAPQDDKGRLPIFPILLGDTRPDRLPSFLSLFQGVQWNDTEDLPKPLVEALKACRGLADQALDKKPVFEKCPFLGLSAFTRKDALLFFGRRLETLQALAGLGDQSESNPDEFSGFGGYHYMRWLQIEGNSGAGKSSLVQAGMLPMIESGALWPRTGIDHWIILGPMMPGVDPVRNLAVALVQGFADAQVAKLTIDDVQERFSRYPEGEPEDRKGLANVLIENLPRPSQDERDSRYAFLLVIDQFEELFTFADDGKRALFDKLIATALKDPACPLFVISTVRADFLESFVKLPSLGEIYNKKCKRFFIPNISVSGLKEIIEGPAELAGISVGAVSSMILADAKEEMGGALPLVENALEGLWKALQDDTQGRGKALALSVEHYVNEGRLVGMLSKMANELLNDIENDQKLGKAGREGALALLLALTQVNENGRHTRKRISRRDAVLAAGKGNKALGERILLRLSGAPSAEQGGLRPYRAPRLVVCEVEMDAERNPKKDWEGNVIGHVDLIHETLIRPRSKDKSSAKGIGYWPELYAHIEANISASYERQEREIQYRRKLRKVEEQARQWDASRGWRRWWKQSGLRLPAHRKLHRDMSELGHRYYSWSVVLMRRQLAFLLLLLCLVGPPWWWLTENGLPPIYLIKVAKWWLGYSPPLPELVDIKPGSFTMGCKEGRDDVYKVKCSPDEARPVTLDKAYSLGKYEVTFEQYDYYVWDQKRRGEGVMLEYPDDQGWGREDRPVINVSWDDAQAYLVWLGEKAKPEDGTVYRLPTEVEWEYAARGGSDTPFGWAGKVFDVKKANCAKGSKGQTLPVSRDGSWANGFGLHDMIGNASEWTADQSKAGSKSRRVIRGGAWNFDPGYCRAADRGSRSPDVPFSNIGFRVCRGSPIETRDAATLGTEPPSR